MACTCGHAREEHGNDKLYPGSTACTLCGCLSYEEEAPQEDCTLCPNNCPYTPGRAGAPPECRMRQIAEQLRDEFFPRTS